MSVPLLRYEKRSVESLWCLLLCHQRAAAASSRPGRGGGVMVLNALGLHTVRRTVASFALVPDPVKLNVFFHGDNTCAVWDTICAIACREPRYYCDPRSFRTVGVDFKITMLTPQEIVSGGGPTHTTVKLQLWEASLFERFRLKKRMLKRSDAAVVLFDHRHAHDKLLYATSPVEELWRLNPDCPISMVPSTGSSAGAGCDVNPEAWRAVDEWVTQAAAQCDASTGCRSIKLAAASASSPTAELCAVLVELVTRALATRARRADEAQAAERAVAGGTGNGGRCVVA